MPARRGRGQPWARPGVPARGWRLVPAAQEPEGGPRAHLLPADPGFGANTPEFYADLCLCVSVCCLPTPALQGLLRLISGPQGSDSARGTPCRPYVTVSAVFSISEPCHGTTGVFRAVLCGVCALSTSRVPKYAQDFWATAVGGAKSGHVKQPAGLVDRTVLSGKTDPHQQRVPQCSACRPGRMVLDGKSSGGVEVAVAHIDGPQIHIYIIIYRRTSDSYLHNHISTDLRFIST